MSGNFTPSFKSLIKLTQLSCGKSCGKPRPMDVNSWDLLFQGHLWFWILPHLPPAPAHSHFISCCHAVLWVFSLFPHNSSYKAFLYVANTIHYLKWRGSYKIKKETTSSWMSAVSGTVFLLSFLQALLFRPPTYLLHILYSLLCFTSKFQLISNEDQSLHHHSLEFLQLPGYWLGIEKTRLTLARPFAALGFFYLLFEFSTASVTNFLSFLQESSLASARHLAGRCPTLLLSRKCITCTLFLLFLLPTGEWSSFFIGPSLFW